MIRTLAYFCMALVLGSGVAALAQTPYLRLRGQFDVARLPEVEDLQLGQRWNCSGSLKAAKGVFRHVRYWEPSYRFQLRQNQIVNQGPRPIERLIWSHRAASGEWSSSEPITFEHLRVNEQGDLLVEVSQERQPASIFSFFSSHHLSESLIRPGHSALLYFVCENPLHHQDEDWFRNRRIWSEQSNK